MSVVQRISADDVRGVGRESERRVNSRLILASAVNAFLFLAGCSINDFGFVEARTFMTADAEVQHTSAVGLHLDTRHDVVSLSLGAVRLDSIHALPCIDRATAVQERRRQASERSPIQLSLNRLAGLQIEVSARHLGLTLGVRDRLLVFAPNESQAGTRLISYRPAALEQTSLTWNLQNACP